MSHAGELAALATAGCWAVSALTFEVAGRRIGSMAVNIIRLAPALLLLTLWGWAVRGRAFPTDASMDAWIWLTVSGWIGFVVGDMCLFRALVLIGARLSTLVMSLWPSMAAVLGWIILGETLALWDVVGMALTLAGIALAGSERAPGGVRPAPGALGRGLVLAVLGALGQAGGLVLSKYGMGSYDPFAATQIRVVAAVVGFSVVFTAIGWWPRVRGALRDGPAVGITAIGACFGPFLGVSLSLVAVAHTATGVGASIMATTPILILPLVVIGRRERVGPRAVLGALLAVSGVALLFLG